MDGEIIIKTQTLKTIGKTALAVVLLSILWIVAFSHGADALANRLCVAHGYASGQVGVSVNIVCNFRMDYDFAPDIQTEEAPQA